MRLEIDAVDVEIAEGDLVATRKTWRGDHPGGGSHLLGRTIHLFRIADGQIAEEWSAGWEWLLAVGVTPSGVPKD